MPVNVLSATAIAHGTSASGFGLVHLMEANRKGGGKTGRKINDKREQSLKEQISAKEIERAQAKTKSAKDEITKILKHLRLKLKKSEVHFN